MSGGRRAAVGIGAVAVVVAAAVAFLLWPRGTTEISEKGLCCRFRGLLGWVSAGAPRLVPTFPDV